MAPRLLTFLAIITLLAGCNNATVPGGAEEITVGGEAFTLELSADDASREQGLMHRAELDPSGGMLFVFPDAQMRSFWMAYCVIDIDLIFVDGRGRVTAVHEMKALPPRRDDESTGAYENRCRTTSSYPSGYPAQFAIELAAGSVERLGVKVEDRIELDLSRLKALAR